MSAARIAEAKARAEQLRYLAGRIHERQPGIAAIVKAGSGDLDDLADQLARAHAVIEAARADATRRQLSRFKPGDLLPTELALRDALADFDRGEQ